MTLKGELSEYQKQLADLSEKLKALKKKYLGKSESRRSAEVKRVRREAERVGSDLEFVRSLLEGLEELDTSLASRLLKRVIPGKAPPPVQDISAEFKQSLLAFSTRFFRDRLQSIEASVRPRNKGHTELDSTQSSSPFSEGSRREFSQVNSEFGVNPFKKGATGACFYNCNEPSEKSVQTDYCDFVPKLCFSNSSEKFVQTDDPNRPTIIGEILEALKKISEDYVPSDRSAFHESDFSNDGFSELSGKDSEWGDVPPHAEFGMNRRESDRKKDQTEAFRMEFRSVDIGDEAKYTVRPETCLTKKSSKNDRNPEKTSSRKVHIVEFHETGLARVSLSSEKQLRYTDVCMETGGPGINKTDTMKTSAGVTKAKSHEVELWSTREEEDTKIKSRENKSPQKTRTKPIRSEQQSPSNRKTHEYESDFRSDSGGNLNGANPKPEERRAANPPLSAPDDKGRRKSYTKPLKKSESHRLKHRHSEEIVKEVKRKARRCNSSESSYHMSLESVHNKEDAAGNIPAVTPDSRSSKSSVSSRPKTLVEKESKKGYSQKKEPRTRTHVQDLGSKQKDRSRPSRPKSGNKERQKDLQEEELQDKSSGRYKEVNPNVKTSNSSNPASTRSGNNEISSSGCKERRKKIRKAKSHDLLKKPSRSSEEGMKQNVRDLLHSHMSENKGQAKKTDKVVNFEDNAYDVTDNLNLKRHVSDSSTRSTTSEKARSIGSCKVGVEEVKVECGELDVAVWKRKSRLSSPPRSGEKERAEDPEEQSEDVCQEPPERVEAAVVGESRRERLRVRHPLLRVCLPGLTWPVVFHRREAEGRVTREGGVTVRLARHLDTLLISHSHQPGTIILADFGGSPTQAEILGRIVGYLVGVPPPTDKT